MSISPIWILRRNDRTTKWLSCSTTKSKKWLWVHASYQMHFPKRFYAYVDARAQHQANQTDPLLFSFLKHLGYVICTQASYMWLYAPWSLHTANLPLTPASRRCADQVSRLVCCSVISLRMAYNILIHAKICAKRTNRLLACTGDSSASALKLELGTCQ